MKKDQIVVYHITCITTGKKLYFAHIQRATPKGLFGRQGRDYILTQTSKIRLHTYAITHNENISLISDEMGGIND